MLIRCESSFRIDQVRCKDSVDESRLSETSLTCAKKISIVPNRENETK